MLRYINVMLLATLALASSASADDNQIVEVRIYELVDAAAEQKLDAYLEQALIPALARQGLGPIGALARSGASADDTREVMLLVPGPSAAAVTEATAKLRADEEYQQAAHSYLETPMDEPIVVRIRSELLLSFDCWPQVVVPQQMLDGEPRLFELRIYESPTEKRGQLKVQMFNSGEVPIFLDCGIAPVFMGQALISDKLPNLTYMTVFDNAEHRDASWKKFSSHPDWQTLRAVEIYQGSVSTIHKSDWVPKPYSQL